MQCEQTSVKAGRAEITPETLYADQICSVCLCYTVGSMPIKKGGTIRVQIPMAFSAPQLSSPLMPGFTMVQCENQKVKLSLSLEQNKSIKDETAYVTRWGRNVFIVVEDGELHENDKVYLYYGYYSIKGEEPITTVPYARAPYFSGKHEFTVAIDPDGQRGAPYSGFYQITEQPFIMVKPLRKKALRVVTPTTGDRHDVRIVSIDKERNPVARENQFKIEDKEVNILGENKVIRYKVKCGGLYSRSNPSIGTVQNNHIYWGDIHGHSICSDGLGTPEDYYEYAKNIALLDFASLTDHGQELSDEDWEMIKKATRVYNVPGRFVTILGYEFSHPVKGDKNIYYPGDDGPLLREKKPFDIFSEDCFQLEDYVSEWKKNGAIMMFHQHSGKILEYYDPELVRLLEIYSNLGCCEQEEAMPRFLPSINRNFSGNYIIDGLNAGYLIGFTGNGDDHTGRPGGFDWHRVRRVYPGGLTAVYAKELKREDIFQALYQRHCYATTGARIAVNFQINGKLPGDILEKTDRLNVTAIVAGTDIITCLELIYNGSVIHQFEANKTDVSIQLEIPEVKDGYYYLRVNQVDGNRAWTSPIYILK